MAEVHVVEAGVVLQQVHHAHGVGSFPRVVNGGFGGNSHISLSKRSLLCLVSWSSPAATNVFVTEPIQKRVWAVTGYRAATSASPNSPSNSTEPWLTSVSISPGTCSRAIRAGVNHWGCASEWLECLVVPPTGAASKSAKKAMSSRFSIMQEEERSGLANQGMWEYLQ